ncbi:MAG: peptidoglycan -binding protein, partial [Acetobacteraceae bacterium]
NKALQQLNQEVAGLSDMLALEKSHTAALQLSVSQLTSQLQTEHAAKDSLARQLAALQAVETKAVSARDAALGAKAALAAELADAELRLKSGNTRLAELQAELATAGGRADTAEQASKATNAKLVSTAAELAAATKRLADMRAEMAQLDREVKVNEATVAARLSDLTELSEQVQALQALRDSLEKKAEAAAVRATTEAERRAATAALLAKQKDLADSAVAKIALLNEQVTALRNQLASISAALDLSEKADKAKGVQIADLGRKLNAALAAKVQKLELYRSEFFGKLRQALANQAGIRVVGDRFVLQNEVLFPIGSADLTPEGKLRIIEVALTLQQIDKKIPPDLHWILQVEGYTDATPINTPQYPSNWELSAQRAINVVQL